MTETINLGVLFRQAKKGQLTERQKNPKRNSKKTYKKSFKTSGIRSVAKVNTSTYEQGFYFKFTHKDGDKYKTVQAKTLKKLYDKIQEKGYNFIIYDIKKARNFFDKNCNDEDYNFFLYNVLQVKK